MLVDFDGPICDLFGPAPTAHIAEEIKVMARRKWGVLDQAVEDCDDSHGILLKLRAIYERMPPALLSRTPLDEAHRIVTEYEYAAVDSAKATPDFEPMLDALFDRGKRLVVVSNNAEGPVWEYLKRKQLQSKFVDVCGRDPHEPGHMKPHPDSLRRALKRLDDLGRQPHPSRALMLGDQLTDLMAARAAGVRFLGYTDDAEKARKIGQGGADWVVASHAPVVTAARTLVATAARAGSTLS
ncbi:HAD family hydrolase [Streptomyces flaveus]|uniref:HAD family hydrolase n=1 Tax=Streptomyces flaveus TaxID=66370 RepID=UPI003329EA0A